MAINIISKNEVRKINNLIMVLYAMPGLGKTSAAFTASNALLLDFDNGVMRAAIKGDSTPAINDWSDVASLDANDLQPYQTIVIDTIGRALEVLSDFIIKTNPKCGKADGSLSLQGYGALNVAFKSFMTKLRGFGKDIVILAHSKEDKDGDSLNYRIDSVGSSKQEIYKIADMIGYIYTVNNKRTISFNPSDNYTGKNSARLPVLTIPDIQTNDHYLADLIQQTKDTLNSLSESQLEQQKLYDDALQSIDNAESLDDFNQLLTYEFLLKNQALKSHLHVTATDKGYIYVADKKQYADPNAPELADKVSKKVKEQTTATGA